MDDNGYAVGWVTLALINAGLAQTKNRSGLLWFLGSLLIGPLATLLIVIAVEARPRPKRHADDQSTPGPSPDPGQTTPAHGS